MNCTYAKFAQKKTREKKEMYFELYVEELARSDLGWILGKHPERSFTKEYKKVCLHSESTCVLTILGTVYRRYLDRFP